MVDIPSPRCLFYHKNFRLWFYYQYFFAQILVIFQTENLNKEPPNSTKPNCQSFPFSGNLFFCRFIACHCARAGTVVFPKMLKCQFIQPAVKIYLSQIALRNSLSIFQICHFFWVPEKIIFNANTKSAKIDFSLENFCVGRISWLNSTKPDK